jgi:radical SAM protein with 4Fe4S-binding SPASM domain
MICTQLFESPVINVDGSVFPCCFLTDQKNSFGNILTQDFDDIWYNDKYESSRSLFVKKKNSPGVIEKTICFDCKNFKKLEI